MSDDQPQVPRSFWIIGGLALVWNLIGVWAYVVQVTLTERDLLAYPEAERGLYADLPIWATSAFAIAVTAGAAGCILLLLRSLWAVPLFLVSLVAILVQMYHAFVIADALEVLGWIGAIRPTLIVAIGVGLIWYSRMAKDNGWLR